MSNKLHNSHLSDKVLEALKEKHINPKPKWHFVLRDMIMWCLFGFILAIGALAISVMLFILTDSDWGVYRYLHRSPLEHALLSLPYIWIVIVLLLIALSILYFGHTKKGYQHKLATIVLTNIGASVLLGTLFFYSGLGSTFNELFSKNITGYKHLLPQHQINWTNPQNGILAGQVYQNQLPAQLIIIDFADNRWTIVTNGLPFHHEALLRPSTTIKLFGTQVSTSTFKAVQIKPWYKSIKPLRNPIPPRR